VTIALRAKGSVGSLVVNTVVMATLAVSKGTSIKSAAIRTSVTMVRAIAVWSVDCLIAEIYNEVLCFNFDPKLK
jgi:hypothetical protein